MAGLWKAAGTIGVGCSEKVVQDLKEVRDIRERSFLNKSQHKPRP